LVFKSNDLPLAHSFSGGEVLMRNRETDEQWIRDTVKQAGVDELVYVTPNHYDGGYEVKVGVSDVFVDYGAIDAGDGAWIEKLR
jgi:hypothetical protein